MQRFTPCGSAARRLVVAACIASCASIVACSRKSPGTPDLAAAGGVITLDGQPLGNVIVLFTSAAGMSSFGTTDASGRYEVAYRSNLKGAAIGPSIVRITTNLTQLPGAGYRDPIPAKYNTASTLKVEVKPGANTFDFSLTSK